MTTEVQPSTNVSVPCDRSAPEAVVVEEDIIPGGSTFMKGVKIVEIIKGLEAIVVFHHHTRNAAAVHRRLDR